jgi:opacity protein-like surface antigen
MKRLLLAAIAVVAAFAARPATSADLPMAPVYQPPPPIVPVYSWTGCYLGGTVGTGWSSWNYSNPTDNLPVPGVVPSPVVLEFGDAISGISRVPGQAARSIG